MSNRKKTRKSPFSKKSRTVLLPLISRTVLQSGPDLKAESGKEVKGSKHLFEKLDISLKDIRKNGTQALSEKLADHKLGAIIPSLIDFMHQGDESAVFSFFRQITLPGEEAEAYYLTTLTYRQNEDAFYCLNIPVTSFGETSKKLAQVIERDKFRQENESRFGSLTNREKEVLRLISSGFSSLEISEELFISKHTVEVHRRKIREKINARNVVDFVHFAEAFDLQNS